MVTKPAYYDLFEGQRVELIGGQVFGKPRPSPRHAWTVSLLHPKLREFFGDGYVVCVNAPMNLGEDSEPEPDLMIVKGSVRSLTSHPTSAELVIEYSDSTLALDSGMKASLYARHGVREYWIVNLRDQCLEVRRRIVADGSEPFGFRYEDVQFFEAGDAVAPVAAPRSKIAVADLLP